MHSSFVYSCSSTSSFSLFRSLVPAVHGIAWFGDEPKGKFSLEHKHGATEGRAVRQKAENDCRRNVVRNVGHHNIEKGEFDLQGKKKKK